MRQLELHQLRSILWVTVVLPASALFFLSGCGMDLSGDQGKYEQFITNLSSPADNQQTTVQLYGTYWFAPYLNIIHSWFLVKYPHSDRIDRWEVTPFKNDDYGYVVKNGLPPFADFGGGVFLIAEIKGEEALRIAKFIENNSKFYPAQEYFRLLTGPNCNTYTQWVLDQTGWVVPLPSSAMGSDIPLL